MASAPASKMKRMLLGPAFCLDKVAEAPKEDPLVNAAECQPMSLITENLLLGSWRDATDHATLRAAGVTHVLNVAREVVSVTEAERAALLEGDFQHLSLPMADSHSEDIHRHFDEAFAFIDGARAAPAGRVLVHCRRGISRSAAIVVAYLMREQQCDYAEALRFVEARRRVSLNLAFRELLEHYRPSPACGSVGSCRAIASGATAAVAAAESSTSSAHHAIHHNCACGGVASGDGDATFDSDSEARAIGGAAVGGGGFGDENDDPVSPPKVGAGVGSGTGTTAGMSRGVSSVEEDFASQDAAPASSSHTRRPFVVDT